MIKKIVEMPTMMTSKAQGEINEEPVITSGSVVKRWTNVRWSEKHVWKSKLDTARCKCIVPSKLPNWFSQKDPDERVDTNKRDEWSPEILLPVGGKGCEATQQHKKEKANFFASTPPLEAVKLLISENMTKSISKQSTVAISSKKHIGEVTC